MGWGIGRTPLPHGVMRSAVVHVSVVVGIAIALLIGGAVASRGRSLHCESGTISECLAAGQYVLIFGPPIVLACGGLAAFARTYFVWRRSGPWMVWLGAGWFQFVVMIAVIGIAGAAVAG